VPESAHPVDPAGVPAPAYAETPVKAMTLVDIRLQLARALDKLVSPGSDLPFPGWPWRWPDDGDAERLSPESSSFVREWVAAGQGTAPKARRPPTRQA